MLVNTYEYLNLLQEVCAGSGDGQLVWTPPMFASMQVFVFEDAWVEEVFNPFWWAYVTKYREERNQPLENNGRRGICDEITEHCVTHFNVAVRKLMGDADCRAGAIPTRVFLPAGCALNNVPGPGGHELIVLATTKNQKDTTLYAYESQNRRRTPLADAVAGGLVVRAQWV